VNDRGYGELDPASCQKAIFSRHRSITLELSPGFDAPPEKLRSAFAMLLGKHMELIVAAQRATFAGAQEFKAAAAQLNANTTTLTQAMGAIVGPKKGAEFQAAWGTTSRA
jgi:hypothetical protein